MTVGQALVFAKQEYSAMPLAGGYDVKVIDGSGLYGLPMYRVGTGATAPRRSRSRSTRMRQRASTQPPSTCRRRSPR